MSLSIKSVLDALGYTASLPERVVRSLAAAVGGVSKLATDYLVPAPLRNTNTYRVLVGNTQRFVIEQVAEVEGVYAKEGAGALPDNYVPRKIAGNVLEAVGLFSMHLSPLWVFAIATDVAGGSKEYLRRLVAELKAAKVLSSDATIGTVDQLLDAVGQAGNESATVFDAPPVNVAEIRQLRDRLTAGYTKVFSSAGNMVPRMDAIWSNLESLARRDNVAIEAIVGLMTIDLGKAAGKTIDAAFAVGSATTDVLAETIFRSYGETLARINSLGAMACLEEATKPFLGAIVDQWSARRETLTQRLIRRIRRWCGGGDGEPKPAAEAAPQVERHGPEAPPPPDH